MKVNSKLLKIYKILYKSYGPQGWWPLFNFARGKILKTKLNSSGYHPGNYSLPENYAQQLQIAFGAILTQSTNWNNVVKALKALAKAKLFSVKAILKANFNSIAKAIKSSGYYFQKAKKIIAFCEVCAEKGWFRTKTIPTRAELLSIWGIGPETADSILLYAFKKPYFVVDAYTKRIFTRLGFLTEKSSYQVIQDFFHQNLKADYELFNEYHALLVELAKRNCRKKPLCQTCPLNKIC